MPGLRERNKAKRRDAILEAALELLDVPGPTVPTTEQIAERAGVSPATVYNLVGPREQLLLALVDRSILGVVAGDASAASTRDPVQALRDVLGGLVDLLVARPHATRKVVLQLTAAASPDLHTTLSPARVIAAGLRRAQAAKVIDGDVDADVMAFGLYLSFNGALLRWAVGALSEDGFRAAVDHGFALGLAAHATRRSRPAMLEQLRAAAAALASANASETGARA